MMKTKFSIAIVCSLFLVLNMGYGKNVKQVAESLKTNVVKIKASSDNHDENGFGFIIGERGDSVFVVTATHVVLGDQLFLDKDQLSSLEIQLEFFGHQEFQGKGRLLNYSEKDNKDIALIIAPRPSGDFLWERKCYASSISEGQRVSFIGRSGEWYIPEESAEGIINSLNDDNIIIDITSVLPGTSGAPLINKKGIAGMIIIDQQGGQSEAISIEAIQAFVDFDGGSYMQMEKTNLVVGILVGGIISAAVGVIALPTGISSENNASGNYEIYKENRIESADIYTNPSQPGYRGLDRNQWYDDANSQHKRGVTATITGSGLAALGLGGILHFFLKNRKKKKKKKLQN